MGPLLDIILSLVVRGAIVLAVLNVTVSLQSKLSEKTAQVNEFALVNTVAAILRQDLDKTGFNMGGPPYISVASADTIEVCYNSIPPPAYPVVTPTKVKFYTGPRSELSSTANPNDRILYKSVNGGSPLVVAKGVTSLKFVYYNSSGNTTSNTLYIKSFSVDLIMAGPDLINNIYPAAEWNTRLAPFGMR
jgi:hypothetical protein